MKQGLIVLCEIISNKEPFTIVLNLQQSILGQVALILIVGTQGCYPYPRGYP